MSKKEVAGLVAMLLLFGHLLVIAEDVQAVIQDPNQDNKPGEVLKLAFDVSRYLR